MVVVTEGRPTDPAVPAFRTYLNYLDAYRRGVTAVHGSYRGYLDACLACSSSLQGKKTDTGWVERYLPIAWNTEHLIHQAPKDNPSLLRIANHWLPIQTYYALYCGAEAAGSVLDGTAPDGHAAAMRSLTAYFVKSGASPWDLGVKGPIGRDRKQATPLNFPPEVRIPHNLETTAEPLGMLGKCLLSEHKHRVSERWDSKSRSGCYKYEFDPGTTGFLHFLYRLRVKANYRDVDIFLAEVEDHEVLLFTNSLRAITYTGLTAAEVILMRRLGKRYLLGLAGTYLGRNPSAAQLDRRLEEYRSAF